MVTIQNVGINETGFETLSEHLAAQNPVPIYDYYVPLSARQLPALVDLEELSFDDK